MAVMENGQHEPRVFSVEELASLWAVSTHEVRRLFHGQPGVRQVPHPGAPHKRKFDRTEISEEAVLRVYEQNVMKETEKKDGSF